MRYLSLVVMLFVVSCGEGEKNVAEAQSYPQLIVLRQTSIGLRVIVTRLGYEYIFATHDPNRIYYHEGKLYFLNDADNDTGEIYEIDLATGRQRVCGDLGIPEENETRMILGVMGIDEY